MDMFRRGLKLYGKSFEKYIMPVDLLRHFTILTKNVEETSKFLKTALGVTDGYKPEVAFPLVWLYCGKQPVIHVAGKESPGHNR